MINRVRHYIKDSWFVGCFEGKTQIVTAPMDMMIPEGMEAKFTCTGTTDPDEVENLQITWKKDNQTINYQMAQRIFQNAIDNSVTISGSIYLDTGKYTCVASNGLDSSEASAQLIIQGLSAIYTLSLSLYLFFRWYTCCFYYLLLPVNYVLNVALKQATNSNIGVGFSINLIKNHSVKPTMKTVNLILI